MPETGWVKLYTVRDSDRIETNGPVMGAADWIAAEQLRLEQLGRRVETKFSKTERSWSLRVYVPEPPHQPGEKCWCTHGHR